MSPAHRILLQEDSRLQRNSPVHLENNNRYVSLSVYLYVCKSTINVQSNSPVYLENSNRYVSLSVFILHKVYIKFFSFLKTINYVSVFSCVYLSSVWIVTEYQKHETKGKKYFT